MKSLRAHSSRARTWALLGAFALVLAAAPQTQANSPSRARIADASGTGPGLDDLSSGTDEGIGTLPVIQAPEPSTIADLIPDRFLGEDGGLKPYINFEGTLDELRDLITDAKGDGVATIEPPSVPGGDWNLGFHGEVEVDVDAFEARLTAAEISVEVGSVFSGGIAAACWNGICSPVVVLDAPALALPVSDLIDTGTLDQSSLGVVALSQDLDLAAVDVSLVENGSVLRIQQSFD